MNILECSNIVKTYAQDFKALDNVSINVERGSIFGLLGPNGAGKTTLIRLINQIIQPDSGEILLNGSKLSEKDIINIGYLPEERGLYRKMKVGEQAIYLAQLKGLNRKDAIKELKDWFVKFNIQAWWDKKVEELSKGMAQKVQFITTVLHKPSLLILDEPFSGFDPLNVEIIRAEILALRNQGSSIILSTHNMESVEQLCDNIALINKSKLILSGLVSDIRKQHGNNQVEILYKASEVVQIDDCEEFTVTSNSLSKDSYRLILNVDSNYKSANILNQTLNKIDIISYRELIPRMNDIFIKFVK